MRVVRRGQEKTDREAEAGENQALESGTNRGTDLGAVPCPISGV